MRSTDITVIQIGISTYKNEYLELLRSKFVLSIASREEIFPDEHEAMNVHIRDGAMTRFRRVAGLKLTRERELNRKYAIDQALLSLVDACKRKDPKMRWRSEQLTPNTVSPMVGRS